ncbi:DUF5906 domain-containing protein [Nitrosospira briensis]|uniref:DUF5906 domain-containing protein n=1 Tax=Nitrosospira briensis TaxID=35799 RepID=UPI00046ACC20|nr:DUF5906 domain-containing protein [Nitrosospira briensis]
MTDAATDLYAVPAALRERRQWLTWRFEQKPGDKKPRKMPYYLSGERRNGTQGSPEDRAALASFEEACTALSSGRFSGIGFAFLPGDGLIGIDIDGAINTETGEISERATNIIQACASYTEYSPSRKGVHIIVFGDSDTFKSNDIGVEVFCGRQYFTVTGARFPGTPAEVAPISDKTLARLQKTVDAAKNKHVNSPPVETSGDIDVRAKVESALAFVNPTCGYDEWIQLGMAIHAELGEAGLSVWESWSAKSAKYPGGKTLQSHWKSFKPGGITGAIIFKRAMEAGWRPPKLRAVPKDKGKSSPSPSDKAPEPPEKGGGDKRDKQPINWDRYNDLIDNFALIYSTDTCYDEKARKLIRVNAMRLAFGNDYVKMWLNSDKRRMIMPEQLVFDPSGAIEPPAVNLFAGLPMEAKKGDCSAIIELISHLCAESAESELAIEEVISWTLKWLALPLQRLGTKMRSALVFHGPQGAGKNLFFEIVAKIYGDYALVVGQDQIEDKFNDWASQKLFLIADEVVARQELYHHKNKLKGFITGETIQINTKMMPLRTEANHVNVVFLSNEHQPLALEEGDRRYFVVYTPQMRADDLYQRVADAMRAGAIEAFYRHLLSLDLTGFTEFDIPPMTRAKKDLIELGLKPPERFVREWLNGYLPLPLKVCSAGQLYQAFRRWCALTGERFPPTQEHFTKMVRKTSDLLSSRRADQPVLLIYKVIKLDDVQNGKKAERMWIPGTEQPPMEMTQGKWAAREVAHFERALDEFLGKNEGKQL